MRDIGKSPHVQSRNQALAIAFATKDRAARGHWSGGVAGYDAGGGVNPVNAVINALTAGAGTSGGAAPGSTTGAIGIANQAAPSSPAISAASNPTPSVSPPAATPTPTPTPTPTQASAGTNPALTAAPAATSSTSMPAPAASTAATPATVAPAPATSAPTGVAATNPLGAGISANGVASAIASGFARGGVPKLAGGGFNMSQGPNLMPSWEERGAARSLHVGPVLSAVPGRVDNHAVKVPSGSYVLPSSHLAALGQGNSIAGMSIASRMFGSGPYGTGLPKMGHGSLPRPPKPMTAFADGGSYSDGGARGTHQFTPTPVDISGGEFVVTPQEIVRRWGSLKKGHAALDAWVMSTRKKEIKTLRGLPPPVKK
jgi:hypothetical protein